MLLLLASWQAMLAGADGQGARRGGKRIFSNPTSHMASTAGRGVAPLAGGPTGMAPFARSSDEVSLQLGTTKASNNIPGESFVQLSLCPPRPGLRVTQYHSTQ